MKINIIDELNKLLINTMDYMEVLLQLSNTIKDSAIQKKLKNFSKMAEEDTNKLIQLIEDLGGDVETTARHTDKAAIDWVPHPFPSPDNVKSVLTCLIEAQRKKELDYNTILSHSEMDRISKNRLGKQRRDAEMQLRFFQAKLISLEHKAM